MFDLTCPLTCASIAGWLILTGQFVKSRGKPVGFDVHVWFWLAHWFVQRLLVDTHALAKLASQDASQCDLMSVRDLTYVTIHLTSSLYTGVSIRSAAFGGQFQFLRTRVVYQGIGMRIHLKFLGMSTCLLLCTYDDALGRTSSIISIILLMACKCCEAQDVTSKWISCLCVYLWRV